jgi:Uma2 family endonuclease
MSSVPHNPIGLTSAEPAWEIATLFPPQGAWTVEEYLDFTDSTNRLIEFTDGKLEFLEMPTISHQRILAHLLFIFRQFVDARRLGEVLCATLRVRIAESKFREPDIVFLHKDHPTGGGDRYWTAADLVVEIVSDDPGSRKRDLIEKRAEYAAAGIREYWIVDPAERCINVLALDGAAYRVAGKYASGDQAASVLLAGLTVDVAAVFQAAEG